MRNFPESLLRPPEGAEPLGAFAELGFLVIDAHGDHFLVAAPGEPGLHRDWNESFRLPLTMPCKNRVPETGPEEAEP